MPVGAARREMATDVLVAVDDQRRRRHCTEIGIIEGNKSSARLRDIHTPFPHAAENNAGLDTCLGLVPRGPVARIRVGRTQEQGGCNGTGGVADDRDSSAVEPALESGDGTLDGIEIVEDP